MERQSYSKEVLELYTRKVSSCEDTYNIPSIKKVRLNEKVTKKGTTRKMKIQLDLNREESEGFQALSTALKPESISLNDFIKGLLFLGIAKYTEDIKASNDKEASEQLIQETPNVEVIQ